MMQWHNEIMAVWQNDKAKNNESNTENDKLTWWQIKK